MSCSSGPEAVCSSNISISDYVAGFSQGLDNFSEDRYSLLRTESNSAYERTVNAVTDDVITTEATSVASKISAFISVMDKVDWDVTRALNVSDAITAAEALGSESTLRQANAVEGQLVARCGLPSSIAPPNVSENTLPMNPIPSPITDTEAECLGESLSGIYDVSGPETNNAQYQRQFQRAFDGCGIVFDIPSE